MKQDHPYVGVDGIITNDKGEILLLITGQFLKWYKNGLEII